MKNVRITVVRRCVYLDLIEQYESPIEHTYDFITDTQEVFYIIAGDGTEIVADMFAAGFSHTHQRIDHL